MTKLILKQTPEAFYVEEVLPRDYFVESDSKIYLYKISKTNLSNTDLEKILKEKLNYFNSAGIKDKLANTIQYITSNTKIDNFEISNNEYNLKLEFLNNTKKHLFIGANVGNKFKIKTNYFKKYKELGHLGSPNYFDEQRFGNSYYYDFITNLLNENYEDVLKIYLTRNAIKNESQKDLLNNWNNITKISEKTKNEIFEVNNFKKEIYYLILKKDFKSAIKQLNIDDLKKIYKQYQSHLFNKKLEKTISNPIIYDYKKFPKTKLKKIVITIKFDSKLKEFFVVNDLNRENIFFAKNIKQTKLNNEEAILEFELPKGCYATIFIKHLFAINYI
jgi:tRNA(Glu) U13 pseudouridine synthase TruD